MIYLIRHGKTDKNKANVLQGRSDQPLNDEGIEDTKATIVVQKLKSKP